MSETPQDIDHFDGGDCIQRGGYRNFVRGGQKRAFPTVLALIDNEQSSHPVVGQGVDTFLTESRKKRRAARVVRSHVVYLGNASRYRIAQHDDFGSVRQQ